MGLDVPRRALPEAHGLRRLGLPTHALGLLDLDRVYSLSRQLAEFLGLVAGLGEADRMRGAEALLAGDAVDLVPENPRRGAVRADLKVEVMPVGVEAGLDASPAQLGDAAG